MGFVNVVSLYLFQNIRIILHNLYADINFKEIFELTDRGQKNVSIFSSCFVMAKFSFSISTVHKIAILRPQRKPPHFRLFGCNWILSFVL